MWLIKMYYKFRQKDILKDIRTSPKLIELVSKNLGNISLSSANDILDVLCDLYKVSRLDRVCIDEDLCKRNRWNACYDSFNARVISFRNESCITLKIIYHEFAHHLDFTWNPNYGMTTIYGATECDNVTADSFFNISYNIALNKFLYKQEGVNEN